MLVLQANKKNTEFSVHIFGLIAHILCALLDFEFYDLVWWWDRPDKPNATDDPRRLGRWLGISHRVGSDMCYWLITESGELISKTSVEHVIRDDYLKPDTKARIDAFNEQLTQRLDDTNFQINQEVDGKFHFILPDEDIDENPGIDYDAGVTPTDEEYGDMIFEPRPEDDEEEVIDKYLNMELIFDVGTDNERRGTVVKRSRGLDGQFRFSFR